MRSIVISVAAIHILLVSVIIFNVSVASKPPIKKITVKTATRAPLRTVTSSPQGISTASQKNVSSKPVSPQKESTTKKSTKKTTPPPKKNSTPPPGKKSSTGKESKKGPSPRAQSAVPQELLQELQESIAKIEQKRDKLYGRRRLEAPPAITALRIEEPGVGDSSLLKSDNDYRESLIGVLRASLNLPEYGEVTLRLTLKKDGTVEKVSVLRAESDKNRKYLEKHLLLVRFAPLAEATGTFVLTFCHGL